MRLDPEIKAKVEAAIGKEIPHPATPEFDELLQELRRENPELASLLESGVIYDEMPFPEEEARPRVERRERLRRLRNILLNRYDPLTGEWVPSRQKQVAVGFAAFLLFFIPFFLLVNRPKGPTTGGVPAAGVAAQAPSPQEEDRAGAAPAPQAGGESTAEQGAGVASPPGEHRENSLVPPPPSEGQTTELPTPPSPAEIPPPPPPPSPAEGPGAGAFPPQGGGAYPGLSLYHRQSQTLGGPASAPSPGGAATPSSPAPQEGGSPEGGASSPTGGLSLYSRGKPSALYTTYPRRGGTHPSLTVYAKGGQKTASTPSGGTGRTVAEEVAEMLDQASTPGGGERGGTGGGVYAPPPSASRGGFYLYRSSPPSGAVSPSSFPLDLPPAGGQPGQTGGLPPSLPGNAPAPLKGAYLPGTRLKAKLPVTLILPEGKSQPVVVEAEDGTLFAGEAFVNEARRVEIRFTRVIKGGLEEPINAIAVGEDGAYGLVARIREEAPSLAADLIRGALRGFSDYVKAATQASTVILIPGGGAAEQAQTPPLENFLAAAAADLFSLPQGAKAVVRLAEVKEGTGLSILVLPSTAGDRESNRP